MSPWLLAARPKTLSAAIVPVLMGTALAAPNISWPLFAWTLLGAVLIQIATNFINDAIDFERGADTGERLGPLRVTQAGLLGADAVMRGAWVCLAGAAICGIPLIMRAGWPLFAIGVASMLMAYAYTGGPYPLAYHGLGELFVILFFGVIAVGGTFYVQTLRYTREALFAGLAAGSLATVLIVINNLRDIDSDRRSNKRTLAARFGERFARAEVVFFAIAPFAAVIAITWLPLFALPLTLLVIACATMSRGAALNRCLGIAGALQWAFGILFVLGCSFGFGVTR